MQNCKRPGFSGPCEQRWIAHAAWPFAGLHGKVGEQTDASKAKKTSWASWNVRRAVYIVIRFRIWVLQATNGNHTQREKIQDFTKHQKVVACFGLRNPPLQSSFCNTLWSADQNSFNACRKKHRCKCRMVELHSRHKFWCVCVYLYEYIYIHIYVDTRYYIQD